MTKFTMFVVCMSRKKQKRREKVEKGNEVKERSARQSFKTPMQADISRENTREVYLSTQCEWLT